MPPPLQSTVFELSCSNFGRLTNVVNVSDPYCTLQRHLESCSPSESILVALFSFCFAKFGYVFSKQFHHHVAETPGLTHVV